MATVLTGLAAARAVHWDRPAPGWLPVRGADGGRRLGAAAGSPPEPSRNASATCSPRRARRRRALRPDRGWVRADRPPLTLLHGDLRVDNLLFTDGPEPAVTVVDWQTVQLGRGPATPRTWSAAACRPTCARRGRRSCSRRTTTPCALPGCGGAATSAGARTEVNTVAGLHMTVVGAMLVARDGRGDAMFVAMAERRAAHVTDLDALTLLS
ncbi:phosphotransferase [Micromonospora sp. BRA006-A]|nr:phosphotransferase [Micromonospora sp. BRA006-A]